MKKIGILVAMGSEWAPLESMAETLTETEVFGKRVFTGSMAGRPFAACISGVGKVAAAIGVMALYRAFNPDVILNAGVAGGLGVTPRGSVVVAGEVWQHDFDTTAAGDEPGLYVGRTDDALSERLLAVTGGVRGTVATGDIFVADPVRAAYIRDKFGAAVCEMEAAAAMEAARALGIPFAAVKYVSDGANESAGSDFGANTGSLAECLARDIYAFMSSEKGGRG